MNVMEEQTWILVVDDEQNIRDVIAEALTREGYSVVTVGDGEEALFLGSQQEFAIVILDIRMPDMNGMEVLARFKQMCPDTRVLMLSGVADFAENIESKALESGAFTFLKKPVPMEDLVRIVRESLEFQPPSEKPPNDPSSTSNAPFVDVPPPQHPSGGDDRKTVLQDQNRRHSILVVDDERHLRDVVVEVLSSKGHDVAAARDGHEALALIGARKFDAAVMDIQMPMMSGLQLLERVKAHQPGMIAIILTGAADSDGALESEAMELGAAAFLKKPLPIEKLARVVQQTIDSGGRPPAEWKALKRGPSTEASPSNEEPATRQYSLLVIDGDGDVRTSIADVWGRMGHEVTLVGDDREELISRSREKYDGVVLDIMLDSIEGVRLLSDIKRAHPHTGVVVLTEAFDAEEIVESLVRRCRADVSLRKPVSPEDLIGFVEKAIRAAAEPSSDSELAETGTADGDPSVPQKPAGEASIVVVDMNSVVRSSIAESLEGKGYAVRTAAHGYEAFALLLREKPDAIILDVRLPGIDGLEFIGDLKRSHPEVAVVVVTDAIDPDGIIKAVAMRLGASAFMSKSSPAEKLAVALQVALETREDQSPEEPDGDDPDPATAGSSAAVSRGDRPSVLVVDGGRLVRDGIAEFLTSLGYHVKTARNGYEALVSRFRESFDVVIMDLNIDGMDGIELLEVLKPAYPDTAVIVLTEVADPHHILESAAMRLGASIFIRKPFPMQEIDRVVRDILESRDGSLLEMLVTAPGSQIAPPIPSGMIGRRSSVLAVSDDQRVRDILARMLKQEGYDVGTAGDAEEALSLGRRQKFAAAVLDLKEGGIETMGRFREACPEVKLIMLSALAAEEATVESRAMDMGASAFLKKPVSVRKLIRVVRGVVELGDTASGLRGSAQAVPDVSGPNTKKAAGHLPSVLLVDDDHAVRDGVAEHLATEGYATRVEAHANQVIEHLLREKSDAVVLDVRLAGTDGLELVARIKEACPDVGVVVLTGVIDPDGIIKSAAIRSGADAYLRKRVRLKELVRALQEVLGQRSTMQGRGLPFPGLRKHSILLVETQPEGEAISGFLTEHGYDVHLESEAEDVLACRSQERFDAVVVNIMMTGLDGIHLLRRLKGQYSDDLIVVLSPSTRQGQMMRVMAQDLGARVFIRTPVRTVELMEALEEIMTKHDGVLGRD